MYDYLGKIFRMSNVITQMLNLSPVSLKLVVNLQPASLKTAVNWPVVLLALVINLELGISS
jgi:hypothetical protein